MEIDYATLEHALMRLFDLSETQREGLRGRLKYLGQLNALAVEPIGRGRRAYRLEDILRLVLILELEDIGCAPKHAARMVAMHWSDLQADLAKAWHDVRAQEAGEPIGGLLWTIIPRALSEMGSKGTMGDVTIVERAGPCAPQALIAWPGPALGRDRHAVFIHLPKLLAACCEALGAIRPGLDPAFRQALDGWSGAHRLTAAG